MDFANMNARKVGVFTDTTVEKLLPMKMVSRKVCCQRRAGSVLTSRLPQARESLEASGVSFEVFNKVSVEPTDASWKEAIDWARKHDFSHFLALVTVTLLYPSVNG